ncbi:MAG: hypothetical protein U9O54_07780 [Chloroflexota bacterium]|nr:hypothetical protein [Chloroflexota bacterium]
MTSITFEEVAHRLDEAKIPWCVFAGAAAAVYGSNRSLTDVDILIPAVDAEQLINIFPEVELALREDGTVWGGRLPDIDILAGIEGMDLDTPMAFRLTRHEIMGVMAPIIPPEDNILLKAMWGRGPDVGKHDWEDVEAMLGNVYALLDWDYLYWRAKKCGAEHVLEQLKAIGQTNT